jgi:hypothetical protein
LHTALARARFGMSYEPVRWIGIAWRVLTPSLGTEHRKHKRHLIWLLERERKNHLVRRSRPARDGVQVALTHDLEILPKPQRPEAYKPCGYDPAHITAASENGGNPATQYLEDSQPFEKPSSCRCTGKFPGRLGSGPRLGGQVLSSVHLQQD